MSARIVNSEQTLYTGVVNPRGLQSRVVTCSYSLPAGGGNTYSFTPPVGQRLYLQAVDIDWSLMPGGAAVALSFQIRTGTIAPLSYADISAWDIILPTYMHGKASPWLFDLQAHKIHLEMNKLFEGTKRRFGFSVVGSNTNPGYFLVSFQIAEF